MAQALRGTDKCPGFRAWGTDDIPHLNVGRERPDRLTSHGSLLPLSQFGRIRRSVYHPSVIYVGRTKQSHQPCQAAGAERGDDTDTMVHVIAIPAAVV